MRRLRIRLLVNSWTVPQILPVLAVIWTADAFLIVVLAIPWLLVSWAFSSGAINCPSCDVCAATARPVHP